MWVVISKFLMIPALVLGMNILASADEEVSLKPAFKLTVPRTADPVGPIHDVAGFFFARSRIVALIDNVPPSIVITNQQGGLLKTISLPRLSNRGYPLLAKVSDSECIVVSPTSPDDGVANAWSVDLDRATVKHLVRFEAREVKSIAAFPDGSFVVLSERGFFCCDADGRVTWSDPPTAVKGFPGAKRPEAVNVDPKGRILLTDEEHPSIYTLSRQGRVVSYLDVAKKWGIGGIYPTSVAESRDGSTWLISFNANKPVIHASASGKLLTAFYPTLPTGRRIMYDLGVVPDSNGNPWISDRYFIYRLGSKGIVDRMVGGKPRTTGLGDIYNLIVGYNGRVYVQDRVTQGVSVFDPLGRLLFDRIQKPADLPDPMMKPDVYVSEAGDIYINDAEFWTRFAPDGKLTRTRLSQSGMDSDLKKGPAQVVKPSYVWNESLLYDEKGKVVGSLNHEREGGEDSEAIAVAEHGGVVVVEWPRPQINVGGSFSFYAKDGKLIAENVPISEPLVGGRSAAFDGRVVYLATVNGLYAFDREGKELWHSHPAGWTGWERIFSSQDKLAVWDGKRTVTWYDLPKQVHTQP